MSSSEVSIARSISRILIDCSMVSASNTLMPVEIPSATLLVTMVTMTVLRLGSLENAEAMSMPSMTKVESNIVLTKKRRMVGPVSGSSRTALIFSLRLFGANSDTARTNDMVVYDLSR